MDLFNLKDTLMIFDLTNSYFEGRKLDSILSKFGRSKEKRNDCKIISFSAVVNSEGFLRQSKIYQGNIADTKTLLPMISEMKKSLNTSNLNEIIVMDAGISSEENLSQLRADGQKYVCVSRTQLKDYQEYTSTNLTQIEDKRGNKIELKIINYLDKPDKWILIKSELKEKKENSMLSKIEQKFEEKLSVIRQSIHKKRGTKQPSKIWERIGRVKQQCTRVQDNYNINVQEENGIVTQITWEKKDANKDNRSGIYFIRTNVEGKTDQEIWDIYNTIREVESTFRCLKTDLKVRPIFHQKDKYCTAHLQLGLMAYQLVAAIRHQLKQEDINMCWSNIVRIMNSQKMNTIQMKMRTKEVHIRKMSIPEKSVKQIYDLCRIKEFPKPNKKYVLYH